MTTAFAFDLDGTLTTQEVLPLIATELGLQREMRVLTDLTLSGAIPFEDSFRLRCAVLSAVPISKVRDIVSDVPLDPDIEAFVRKRPSECFVVTGNLDIWVSPLVERLGCQLFASRARADGDRLASVETVLLKSHPVQQLRERFERVVAIGESMNDLPMFEVADVSVAFGGVHRPARAALEACDYVVYQGGALCRLLNTL